MVLTGTVWTRFLFGLFEVRIGGSRPGIEPGRRATTACIVRRRALAPGEPGPLQSPGVEERSV